MFLQGAAQAKCATAGRATFKFTTTHGDKHGDTAEPEEEKMYLQQQSVHRETRSRRRRSLTVSFSTGSDTTWSCGCC